MHPINSKSDYYRIESRELTSAPSIMSLTRNQTMLGLKIVLDKVETNMKNIEKYKNDNSQIGEIRNLEDKIKKRRIGCRNVLLFMFLPIRRDGK